VSLIFPYNIDVRGNRFSQPRELLAILSPAVFLFTLQIDARMLLFLRVEAMQLMGACF